MQRVSRLNLRKFITPKCYFLTVAIFEILEEEFRMERIRRAPEFANWSILCFLREHRFNRRYMAIRTIVISTKRYFENNVSIRTHKRRLTLLDHAQKPRRGGLGVRERVRKIYVVRVQNRSRSIPCAKCLASM